MSSFRKIRPSFGESSASISNPSHSTSESTGSDPTKAAKAGDKEAESSSTTSKRRRVPESVTRNACLNCKKARAKCDGKKPCTRCTTRVESSECKYEIHIKHAKEELVRQIKDLRAKDHLREQILSALSSDEQVPEIVARLQKGETYDSIVEWLGRAPIEEYYALSPRESQHSTFEPSDQEMGGLSTSFSWTSVVSDTAVLDHLFQLYFAWIHPVHTLFSEGHFVDSYKRQSYQFCSPTLVNAMCALACHLHTGGESEEIDFEQLGMSFSDAVRASIDPEDRSLTMTQAFAVIFLLDCAGGNCLRGASYLKIATSNLSYAKSTDSDAVLEVLKNTTRGLRSINVEWAQMTFQVPTYFQPYEFENNEANDATLDKAQWYFYRYVNDQCPAWPGLLATTNREKEKLTDIINDVSTLLYSPSSPQVTARQILHQYARYLDWRQKLPQSIGKIESNNSQALPHVLSLLILYSTAVVQLLRPLLDFEGFPSESVEDIIWAEGQRGLFLLDQHYRTQYTCRYQPVLQMFGLLHFCELMARFFPAKIDQNTKDGPSAIQFGLEALMESRSSFPVAGPFQELLRRLAVNCKVHLPRNLDVLMASNRSPKPTYKLDDLIDACGRPSFVQPTAQIRHRYCPTIAAEWALDGPSLGFNDADRRHRTSRSEEERGAQNLMQIRNLLNLH